MLTIDHLLNTTFTSTRPTRTADGQGGHTKGYAANGTFRGRIRPLSAGERIVGDRTELKTSHRLYVAWGEDILRDDRFTVDSSTFDVVAVNSPSEPNTHLEVDCLEIVQGV